MQPNDITNSMPTWSLNDLESAMNAAGIETPNGVSYVDGIIYTHNSDGELVEMDSDAQQFASDWITANK